MTIGGERRHYLYFHLSLLLHPANRIYVRSLHVDAKTLVLGQQLSKAKSVHFFESLIPKVIHMGTFPDESWTEMLQALYQDMLKLYGARQVGGSSDWTSNLSPGDQERIQRVIVRELEKGESKHKPKGLKK